MANTIAAQTVLNPSGVYDTCSYIRVTDNSKSLIISECMPYIDKYAFQFWIKGTGENTISFTCGNTNRKISVKKEWTKFSVIFTADRIAHIELKFNKGSYWIYNTKLEIGDYNTDWSPHPEDSEITIMSDVEDRLAALEKSLLIKQTDAIDNAIDIINKQDLYTERSLTRTEFVSEIYGILNNLDVNMEQIQEGMGKWHVGIYDKSQFKKLTKSAEQSDYTTNQYASASELVDNRIYDDASIWYSYETQVVNDEEEEEENPEVDDDSADSADDSADDSAEEESEVDDRDKFDMDVFLQENGQIPPIEEMMVDDDPIAMRMNGKGKIIYYYTFAKFTERCEVQTKVPFKNASLYINGIKFVSDGTVKTEKATLSFGQGWNLVEIVANEGNLSMEPTLSQMKLCEMVNCCIALPTDRSVKIHTQGSGIYSTLDEIRTEVWDSYQETYTDADGNPQTRTVLQKSRIKQLKDIISLMVLDGDGNYSDLQITPKLIDAITQKFTITDPVSGKQVIVANGKMILESIDTDYLNTDAITSKNFNGGYKELVTYRNMNTGVERSFNKMNLYDYFDEDGNITFHTQGSYLDLATGNFFTPSLIILSDFTDQYGNEHSNEAYFRGNIYAVNSYLEGVIEAREGHLGPWLITDTAIYKGVNAIGQNGADNAYFGDAGFSLSDLFVYNAEQKTLDLKVNSIDISGPDMLELATQSIDGNAVYYIHGVPTVSGYPTSEWNTLLSKHLDELCYDLDTGKMYRFTKKKTGEDSDDARKTQALYKIKFDADSYLRPGDYVSIYYRYGKVLYMAVNNPYDASSGHYSSDSLANAEFIIPTDDFYVYLHINDWDTPTHFWGFAIESVSIIQGTPYSDCTYAIKQDFPNYPIDKSLTVGQMPELPLNQDHANGYAHLLTNKIWYVRSGFNANTEYYTWEEIENAELIEAAANARRALTFLYYDTVNGFILHNGIHELPDGLTQDGVDEIEGGNVRLTSQGVDVYNGNTMMAHYGSDIILYGSNSNNQIVQKLYIGRDGIAVKDGVFMLGWNSTIQDYLFKVYDNGNFLFGDNSGLANSPTNNNYIKWDNVTGKFTINADSISIGKQDVASSISNVSDSLSDLADDFADFLTNEFDALSTKVEQQDDSKAQVWKQPLAQDPSTAWSDSVTKGLHEGDIWYQTDTEKMFIYSSSVVNDETQYGWTEMKSQPSSTVMAVLNDKANIFMGTDTPTGTINEGDLWFKSNQDPIKIWNGLEWIKLDYYLNSSDFTSFVNGTYANEIQAIYSQVDSKMQTWKQATSPDITEGWVDVATENNTDLKANHLYDIWLDTSNASLAVNPNGTYKTYVYNTQTSSYEWQVMNVEPPQHIIDNIDGKATVYVGTTVPTSPNAGDLWFKGKDQPILSYVYDTTLQAYKWDEYNKYTDDAALYEFQTQYKATLEAVSKQADGAAESHVSASDPSTSWTTNTLKSEHVGDIWQNTNTNNYYIYYYDDITGEYQWVYIDNLPLEYRTAVTRQARSFITEIDPNTGESLLPQPPYKEGDLWANATFSVGGVSYVNELMICCNSKAIGSTASGYDWKLPTNSLNEFINNDYQSTINSINTKISDKNKIHTTASNTLPTPPYSVGDLWVNAYYNLSGYTYTNDLLVCITAVAQNGTASITHWQLASNYTDSTGLSDFSNEYESDMKAIRNQLDGYAETYVTSTDPSTSWTTTATKAEHVGDIWQNGSTYYRYTYNAGSYSWVQLSSTPPIFIRKALEEKAKIHSASGSSSLPTAPYSVGDLWVGCEYYDSVNGIDYRGEILRCIVARTDSSARNINDWELADDYSIKAANAGKTATNYITSDSTGLIVSSNAQSYSSSPFVRLTSNGLDVYGKYSSTSSAIRCLVSYGPTTTFYAYDDNGVASDAATLSKDGFVIKNGTAGGINITNSAIYGASHSAIGSSNSGFYLGSDGNFEVGNGTEYIKFYNGNFSLMLSSLSIGSTGDVGTAISTLNTNVSGLTTTVGKQKIYHVTSVPTNSNSPASSWVSAGTQANYVGTLCYNDNTGKLYKYTDFSSYSSPKYWGYYVTIEYQTTYYDWVRIYYTLGGTTYCSPSYCNTYHTNTVTFFVPNSTFDIYWKSVSTSGFYGYEIKSVKLGVGNNAGTTATAPSVNKTVLDKDVYPSTSHSGYTPDEKFYTCTPSGTLPSGTPTNYEWLEFTDDTLLSALKTAATAKSDASEAAKTATNFLFYSSTDGLIIHKTNGTITSSSSISGSNVRLTTNGLGIYNGSTLLTLYGATTTFYKYGTSTAAATLDSTGLNITNGSISLGSKFSVTSAGELSCSSASVSGTITAGAGSQIGALKVASNSNSVSCFYSGSRLNYNDHNNVGVCIEENGNFGCGSTWTSNGSNYMGWFETMSGTIFAHMKRSQNYTYSLTWGCSLTGSGYDDTYEDTGVLTLYRNNTALVELNARSAEYKFNGVIYSGNLSIYDFANSLERIYLTTSGIYGKYPSSTYSFLLPTNSTGNKFELRNNDSSNTKAFYIDSGGAAYANGVNLTSDIRYKNVINEQYDFNSMFMGLRPIVYTWKNNPDEGMHLGISAQDVDALSKEKGFCNFNFIGYDAKDDKYYANYTEILMLTVPVVQNHEEEIQNLKSEIESLKGEIKRLRKKVG